MAGEKKKRGDNDGGKVSIIPNLIRSGRRRGEGGLPL